MHHLVLKQLPLAAVNQAQSTKLQLLGPRSLGRCAEEKGTPTFWQLHWGLGKGVGKSSPFTEAWL